LGESTQVNPRRLQSQQKLPAGRDVRDDKSDEEASVSIGANIAEGACRKGDIDFARFLQIAAGSASELGYHLLLARDLEMLKATDYQRLSDETVEVKRMLASLMQKLRAES
jgi:four helix bundle protein